jgi:hypothetical protein
MTRPFLLAGLLAGLLAAGACAYDPGAPGSPRRQAFDTLERIDVHCYGHKRIRCHDHLDGVPPASTWRR